MKLRDWLTNEGVDDAEFGSRIERTREAVRRYANGDRIPDRETMPRIVAVTRGEVTANDFFDLVPAARAVCDVCELNAEAPQVSSCTNVRCPMQRAEAA